MPRWQLHHVPAGPELATKCVSSSCRNGTAMLRIAIVAPPFIEVPPQRYGGTELFIANLACDLHSRGHEVTVYGNGDSRLPCRVRWRYAHAEWPLPQGDHMRPVLKNMDHTAWSMRDATSWADVIHLNDVIGVPFTTFVDVP